MHLPNLHTAPKSTFRTFLQKKNSYSEKDTFAQRFKRVKLDQIS